MSLNDFNGYRRFFGNPIYFLSFGSIRFKIVDDSREKNALESSSGGNNNNTKSRKKNTSSFSQSVSTFRISLARILFSSCVSFMFAIVALYRQDAVQDIKLQIIIVI